jgi:peroxiredoxin/outer membrane lipoprotein-sorting protein
MKFRNVFIIAIALTISFVVLGCAKKNAQQAEPAVTQTKNTSPVPSSTSTTPNPLAANTASKPQPLPSAKDVLKKTQEVYKSLRTLSIDGTAKVTKTIDKNSKSTSGKLLIRFARPNKIRLESGAGKESTISVCDGSKLWLYRADINRYAKTAAPAKISEMLGGSLTIKLLEGADVASRSANAKLLGVENLAGKQCFVIEGRIEEPLLKGGSAVTKLWIGRDDYLIRRMRVVNSIPPEAFPEGQPRPKSTLVVAQEAVFKKIVANAAIKPSTFRFVPPVGAKEAGEAGGAGQDSSLGNPAKFFSMPSLSGEEVSLYSMKGRPILIVFWSTLSPISKKHMPVIEKVYEDLKHSGLEVVAVTLDNNKQAAEQFVKENGITFPVLFDYDKAVRIANTYSSGQMGLPTIYVIDKKGVIAGKIVGTGTAEQIKADLAKLGIK